MILRQHHRSTPTTSTTTSTPIHPHVNGAGGGHVNGGGRHVNGGGGGLVNGVNGHVNGHGGGGHQQQHTITGRQFNKSAARIYNNFL